MTIMLRSRKKSKSSLHIVSAVLTSVLQSRRSIVETLKRRCVVSFSSVCFFIIQHVVSPLLLSSASSFFSSSVRDCVGCCTADWVRWPIFTFCLVSLVLLFLQSTVRISLRISATCWTLVWQPLDAFINQFSAFIVWKRQWKIGFLIIHRWLAKRADKSGEKSFFAMPSVFGINLIDDDFSTRLAFIGTSREV